MFDVDEERLEDIANKNNVNYSEVFDRVVEEKKKIFRGEYKQGIFYSIENNAYLQATNVVERYYNTKYNSGNNITSNQNNNGLSEKELKKETVNEVVNT